MVGKNVHTGKELTQETVRALTKAWSDRGDTGPQSQQRTSDLPYSDRSSGVEPGGSEEEVQIILMKMGDKGLVKFDIYKGLWSCA